MASDRLSIAEAGRRFRDGSLTPAVLVEEHLARIARLEPSLNAIATLTADRAREDAARATSELAAGRDRGPLHGIPITLKDNIDTAGVRTTSGSRLFAHDVPARDAGVAARLREAGAVLLGKANMHELALGVETENPIFGQTRNPWDPSRIPGGSSGGSGAAVAAGMGLASIGTDSGGSIRIPASLCGVVGLKPTYGRVSNAGILPNYPSFDCAGPLTASVEDAALMLAAIAGYDPDDFATVPVAVPDYTDGLRAGVAGMRIGVQRGFFFSEASDEVRAAVERGLEVLRSLGAVTLEVDVPGLDTAWTPALARGEISQRHIAAMTQRPSEFSPPILRKLNGGLGHELLAHLTERRASERVAGTLRATLERVDVLVLPTTPIAAPPIEGTSLVDRPDLDRLEGTLVRFLRLFNFMRVPALSVPCGFTPGGMPIGMQLVGRPFGEATLLRAGHAYEQATEWHRRRPPLPA